ncbi:MAG: D-alanyl-D-alanine carboxypeptidase/D-alanyl-D-alanine-endopeptidase, partial [Gemmatimonadota bacterium]|nr:D-alanyl-D-alanine carboxypeptidase/D-alanyl-D-alanine-endopeptidase [Gemmatimonadota bacterium]
TLRHAIGYPRLIVRMTTVAAPAGVQLSVDDDTIAGTITLSGTIALGRDTLLAIAYPQPRDAFLAALRTALRARGVVIRARPTTIPPPAARPLFVISSRPLRDLMPMMEKPSQNQMAEILLKTLGLERGGAGRADSGAAVVGRQLAAWGASDDGFVVRDGSGLSRYDLISPETLVRVLAAMRRDSSFAVYYEALPIAGVDGTMRNRLKGTAAQGNVRAKTGFISNARSLSGYVTTADGRMLVFTALCNNWTARRSAIDAMQDAIALRLATYSERTR